MIKIDDHISVLISEIYSNKALKNKYLLFIEYILKNKINQKFARHITKEDILDEVTEKIISGEFAWDMEKYSRDMFMHFRIRSVIHNIVKKEKPFIPLPLDYDVNDDDFDDNIDKEYEELNSQFKKGGTIPHDFIDDPFEEEYKDIYTDPDSFKATVFEALAEYPREYKVARKEFAGMKPAAIALYFGISTNDVYNIQRRIKRIIKIWLDRNKN